MDEHTPGEGGAANTPPFPRIVPNDELTAASRPPERAREGAEPGDPDRVIAEAVSRPILEEPDIRPPGTEAAASARESGGESARAEGGPPPRPPADEAEPRVRRTRPARPNRAFEEIADHLEDAAERLDHFAASQLGAFGGAERAATSATAAIEDLAGYLRSSDLRSIRDDLSRRVQDRPIQTLLVAVGAGWMVGKVLR